MILPHERVGGDFSWLQGPSPKDRKEKGFETQESRHEERDPAEIFSYGEGRVRGREAQQERLQNASRMASTLLDTSECERIKSILKGLGSADMAGRQVLESSFSKGGSWELRFTLAATGFHQRSPQGSEVICSPPSEGLLSLS